MPSSAASSLADQALLEKFDKLFNCGVGEHIGLPQLVVVGDQSSGKSSVLEALTKLPFPRDKELCTRFATQITFKRSPYKNVSASIIPAPTASDEHKAHVSGWSRPGLAAPTSADFASIILEVQTRMGISSEQDLVRTNFSEDIFKIEISGPEEEHLSIVDVPGIFRNVEIGKTTQADLEMVKRMVTGYMRNPRSVMLAVVAANHDIATQEILTMAKSFDKDGIRTIGVLTKPDLVDVGAEQSVVDLVQDRRYRLTLGWQLVRNSGQADLRKIGHDRDAAEARFFSEKNPWNTLDPDKCGVQSLRRRLQNILSRHIKREFPMVRKEIMDRLRLARGKLDGLGIERGNAREQRAYLTKISIDFERTTNDALQTRYASPVFDEHEVLRLPTLVMSRQDVFASEMQRFGHCLYFENGSKELDNDGLSQAVPSPKVVPYNDLDADIDLPSEVDEDTEDDVAVKLPVRHAPKFPELEDCTIPQTRVFRDPKIGIMAWIRNQHNSSRGFELGSMDPSLLTTAFRGQSIKWDSFSLGYISDIIDYVHNFIVTLLGCVCPDDRVKDVLRSNLADELRARYANAFGHVKFLLEVERGGIPMTVNDYFNDNLQKARQDRIKTALENFSVELTLANKSTRRFIPVDQLSQIQNMSNQDHAIQDFHDILRSYYKVALKRFVDSVTQQAALFYLVSSPNSPLRVFSATYVGSLTDEQLEEIAGEDEHVQETRRSLIAQIATLEEGRKVLS